MPGTLALCAICLTHQTHILWPPKPYHNLCAIYSLRSTFDMLMLRPVLRQCRHQPFDENSFVRAPVCGWPSPPRSISDDRHDDESSKLEPRRWRPKHVQFRNISCGASNPQPQPLYRPAFRHSRLTRAHTHTLYLSALGGMWICCRARFTHAVSLQSLWLCEKYC